MNIKNFKRKFIILSLIFILTGTFISIGGYGIVEFNYNRLKENANDDAWYQTIHVNRSNNLWYGIDLGNDIHLFVIGNSD
ncbi:MAG: hypothetical protein K0R92_1739 [Lachnospiraceae bacterium]|jgi:hypothetical protein|nr:hypothetical protein [Lachnospiraceae bacterium]